MKYLEKFRWNAHYFLAGILLTLIEVFIAVYVHDNFIRPFFGDVLVVFVLYCFLRSISDTPWAIWIVFVFASLVECSQALPLVDVLGIHNRILRILLGTTFDWMDLAAYGIASIMIYESEKHKLLST